MFPGTRKDALLQLISIYLTRKEFSMISRKPRIYWTRGVLLFLFALSLSLSSLLLFSGTASAHADYASSDPAQNANLKAAPSSVSITFTEELNPTGSAITIYDVDGKEVSTGTAQVDTKDQKKMTVPLQGNNSEVYVVLWRTVAADDGHHTSGSFRFFVNMSDMLKGMTANAAAKNNNAQSMTNNASSGGISPLLAGGIALLALVVGAVGGGLVSGRMNARKRPL